MPLPKRSPDLNALDYSICHAINVRMRDQESRFPKSKKESKEQYLTRLRRTALGLPTSFVTKAVQSMKRRVELLEAAKGGLSSKSDCVLMYSCEAFSLNQDAANRI
jgi:hypothetical protein